MVSCDGDAGCHRADTVLADTAKSFTKAGHAAAADKTPAWQDVLFANPSSAGAANSSVPC